MILNFHPFMNFNLLYVIHSSHGIQGPKCT
uniref:Uncharacterized protein n=1 Tax=Anguilla anguilla TaxID=7936 RepID=A0A0E9V9U3_ANGAN